MALTNREVEYSIVVGEVEEVSHTVQARLRLGWKLAGPLSVAVKQNKITFAQPMVRHDGGDHEANFGLNFDPAAPRGWE